MTTCSHCKSDDVRVLDSVSPETGERHASCNSCGAAINISDDGTARITHMYRIEGRLDGQWSTSHVGDGPNLWPSIQAADAELEALASCLECDVRDLRVVPVEA